MYQAKSDNAQDIKNLLDIYKNSKYLKPRSNEYIIKNIQGFYCCFVDEILEGCCELKQGNNYLELGCFVIKPKSEVLNEVSCALIETAILESKKRGLTLISLTNNEGLEKIYLRKGFFLDKSERFKERREVSKGVKQFIYK